MSNSDSDVEIFFATSLPSLAPIPAEHRLLIPDDTRSVKDLLNYSVLHCRDVRIVNHHSETFTKMINPLNYPVPTSSQLQKVISTALDEAKNDAHSLMVSFDFGSPVWLPMWMITLWISLDNVLLAKDRWRKAVDWLGKFENHKLSQCVRNSILAVPWNGKLPSSLGGASAQSLAHYCGTNWLSITHIEQLSALIYDELVQDKIPAKILPPDFFPLLVKTHREVESSSLMMQKSRTRFGEVADALNCKPVVFCVNVQVTSAETIIPTSPQSGHHWTVVIIDVQKKCVLYYDPYQRPPPALLVGILKWWLGHHCDPRPRIRILSAEKQTDTFSGGLYAIHAIHRHFKPAIHSLNPAKLDALRVKYLSGILKQV